MIALNWLRKIDPNLITIVRTEYSTKLKQGTQLAHLVPDIAPNVDNLLSRYSNSTIRMVNGEDIIEDAHNEEDDDDKAIRLSQTTRYQGRGQAYPSSKTSRGAPKRFTNNYKNEARGYKQNDAFCPGCKRLAETQGVNIDFQHNPVKCPRKFVLRSIQQDLAEEVENYEDFGNFPNIIK